MPSLAAVVAAMSIEMRATVMLTLSMPVAPCTAWHPGRPPTADHQRPGHIEPLAILDVREQRSGVV